MVTLEIRNLADTLADAANAMRTGIGDADARIGFASPELLWQVLTPKRWELLKILCGVGPASIHDTARRAGRDLRAVRDDVVALLDAGLLIRSDKERVEFPFDAIKVEFVLKAA